ncbi:hypothetical protein Poly41_63970 [Novipirellula artificiosorum]|uniref:Uncharacterized protein n=1 Tax=Novipirellula artificiosorum TaxID=2528016 RepID=A0A5C6D7I9_9BACT|nr:hypothetical protein Poly41_63970 [Novipirellula artificiosorum]
MGRLGSNLTTEFRPDGSILLMTKGGDIAISNRGILGPYQLVSIDNYTRNSGVCGRSSGMEKQAPVSLHLQSCPGSKERAHAIARRSSLEE